MQQLSNMTTVQLSILYSRHDALHTLCLDEISADHIDGDRCWYTFSIQNINDCELVLAVAYCNIVLISQYCTFIILCLSTLCNLQF